MNEAALRNHFPDFAELFTPFFLSKMVWKSIERGAFICHAGERLPSICFITGGRCRIFRSLYGGRELLLRIYRTGELVGDVEYFLDTAATCSVQATEPLEYAALPIALIRQHRHTLPDTMNALGAALAQKLQDNSIAEAVNISYPLSARLAAYFSVYGGTALQADTLIELSGWFGCSYRHLTRTIASFTGAGLIEKSGRGYRLIDPAALRREAGDVLEEGNLIF
jgi:CRP-like cAMP-binding protein